MAVTRARVAAQGLGGAPATNPEAVVASLLAVQGQDPRGFRLAIRPLATGFSAASVDHALTADRSLVVTWLNRGTLHLVRAEDYPWLQMLLAPRLETGCARRLSQEGVSPDQAERAVGLIDQWLASEGPLTRTDLRDRLESADIPVAGQALIHLLFAAAIRGVCVRGPMVGKDHACVRVDDWLEAAPRLDRDVALAELARRYLAGHGPADDRDLARWTGLPLRDVRLGLAAIASEIIERPDGLVDLVDRERPPPFPAPRLLGAYEPLLLGWRSREQIVGDHPDLVAVNRLFRPFALVNGHAVATWRLTGGAVDVEPLEPLSERVQATLQSDANAVASFLGSAVQGG